MRKRFCIRQEFSFASLRGAETYWETMRRIAAVALCAVAGSASAQVQDAYRALRSQPIWVHSSAGSRVDTGKIESRIRELAPRTIKVLVVPNLGGRWVRNGVEQRGAYAEWLFRDELKLQDGMTVVLTRRGIAAYDPSVPKPQLAQLNDASAKIAQREGFTAGILDSIDTVTAASSAPRSQPAATPVPPVAASTSTPARGGFPFGWLLVGLGGVGGYFLYRRVRENSRLDIIRTPLRHVRSDLMAEIEYLDSYDGLLAEPAASQVRDHRMRANQIWEQTEAEINALKDDRETFGIRTKLENGLREAHAGKNLIEEATGGTKSAFRLPESMADVDELQAPLFDPKPGVCFFTGEPSDDRVPVEFVIDGQRMTVLASREAADRIRRGETPTIAGANVDGENQPWYRVPNYQPGLMGGGLGSGLVTNLLLFNLASTAFAYRPGWGGSDAGGYASDAFASSGGFDDSYDGGFSDSGSFDSVDSGGSDYSGGDDFGGSFD